MNPTKRYRRIVGVILLTLAIPPVLAQGVPRDDHPLPPSSQITPVGPAVAAPGQQTAAGEEIADDIGGLDEMHKVRAMLDELLRAYESGNVARFRQQLDPSMVGYQVFLEGVRRDIAAYRNLRINLTDTQITAGPDLAVIQTGWEKRFLAAGDFTPGIHTGHSTLLIHRAGNGWRLAAVAQDNLFSSASGVLARFTVMPSVISPNVIAAASVLRLEVVDPDMAGVGRVSVMVTTTTGDREVLELPAVSPGVFRMNLGQGHVVLVSAAQSGNGIIEVDWPGTISFRYVDANPGDNRPASTLTRSVRVQ